MEPTIETITRSQWEAREELSVDMDEYGTVQIRDWDLVTMIDIMFSEPVDDIEVLLSRDSTQEGYEIVSVA